MTRGLRFGDPLRLYNGERFVHCYSIIRMLNQYRIFLYQDILNLFKSNRWLPVSGSHAYMILNTDRYSLLQGIPWIRGNETWPHGTYWKGAPFCRPLPIIIISLNSKKYFSKLHISYWQKQKSWYNKCIRPNEQYVCKEIKCRTRFFYGTQQNIWYEAEAERACCVLLSAMSLRWAHDLLLVTKSYQSGVLHRPKDSWPCLEKSACSRSCVMRA